MKSADSTPTCGYIARMCTSFIDVPDRIAVAIYFAGCSIRCPACQNKMLWERSSGQPYPFDAVVSKVKNNPLADSVVFLGGEPTDQIDFLCALAASVADKFRVLYTGREFEVLPAQLSENCDMIICGPYREEYAVKGWPASSNQRVFVRKGTTWIQQRT